MARRRHEGGYRTRRARPRLAILPEIGRSGFPSGSLPGHSLIQTASLFFFVTRIPSLNINRVVRGARREEEDIARVKIPTDQIAAASRGEACKEMKQEDAGARRLSTRSRRRRADG